MLLYRIADTPHHIAGTVHVLPSDATSLSAELCAVHGAAGTVAFEYPPDGSGGAGPEPFLDPPALLRTLVPEETYRAADALRRRLGLGDNFDHLKPWAATRDLMVSLMGGWDYKPGVDAQLWAATDLNRRITLDDEDARWAFDRAPIDEQAAGLARIANDPDDGKRRISRMVAAWRLGGLLALEVFETEMHVMAERAPTVSKALMDDRNALWMPKIQGLVARLEPALILVGSGHLAGPAGLLARLERSGLPVVPV